MIDSEHVRCEERSGRSGRGNVHVKKNQGLAFLATDLMRCFGSVFMKSVTKKHIRVCGAFFSWTAHQYPKISVVFNKKIKNKGTLRQRADPCQALRRPTRLCLSYRFCMPSSLCSASSVTGQIYLEERTVWQVVKKRKNGYLHLNLTM